MLNEYSTPTHNNGSISARPARPAFGYYGAKWRISRQIIDLLPPHNAWVEGFCGSAALTLAKTPVPIEVINDADDEIVNLFRQLRNNSTRLCRAVALTPYSRAEFEIARQRETGLSSLERARRFLVASMMTVNGVYATTRSGFSFSQSFARSDREARVNRWYNLPERLERVVERLRGIRIENRNAIEIVRMFENRPATLMYLDPPYFVKREHKYVIDANCVDFHTELLERCQRSRCMILISAYQNDLYSKLLTRSKGWQSRKIKTRTRDTTGKDFARTELLWMNSRFVQTSKTQRVPIRLTAKERKERKINPPRKR